VCPNKTSLIVDKCFDAIEPVKEIFTGVSDEAAAIVIVKFPVASAENGLLGKTIASVGSPVIVMTSFAEAVPHTRAGVDPPLHTSEDASTM